MPPGYTVQFVLIKFLFSPKQLEEDVRNWDILKISRSDDLWLALLLYCSNLFHEKYGILLSAYYFKKKEEREKLD
jgi:hypothetical protein